MEGKRAEIGGGVPEKGVAAGTSHKERGTGLENRAQLLVTRVQAPTIPLLGEATGSIQGHLGGDSLMLPAWHCQPGFPDSVWGSS